MISPNNTSNTSSLSKSTTNIHLKRAITTNEDVDKALSGKPHPTNYTHACPAQNQQQKF